MPTLLQPPVIRALGPYFWALIFLVLAFLGAAGLALRSLLVANRDRDRHERALQASWQEFLGNHMSENVRINREVAHALTLLTSRLASLEATVAHAIRDRPPSEDL